ncbi:MAG: hypothetical protein JWL66_2671 [Sphingomonadales bacterium]|nr:hypothetical protein [Sphingomonadales bacterium]
MLKVFTVGLLITAVVPTIASARDYYVQAGYPVMLMTRTELSTRDNRAGDRFFLDVAENISAKGQVVIPAGSVAVGEIIRSERNGHWGKSGKMDVRVLFIDTPNGRIPLSGQRDSRGKSGTVPVVATTLFVSIIGGALIHGTSARIPAGTPLQAYLGDDLRFTLNENQNEQSARNYTPASSGLATAVSTGVAVASNNR